jgi:FkbM family methyltransferase
MGKRYDAHLVDFFKERISPGAVCFDIGENVGVYVFQLAEWSKPNGTVVAFEPNPPTAAALRRHITMNQLVQRVKVIEQALADQVGTAEFFAAGCDGTNRLGSPFPFSSNRVQTISVPITTVDEYVAHSGLEPDVMLIDVEGWEIQVLRGAYQVLKRRPEMLLVVEMHPDAWEPARTTRQQAEGLFRELGVSAVALSGQKNPLEEHGAVWLRRCTGH